MQPDRTLNYYLQVALHRLDHGDFADELRVERVYRQLAGDFISRLTSSVSLGSSPPYPPTPPPSFAAQPVPKPLAWI